MCNVCVGGCENERERECVKESAREREGEIERGGVLQCVVCCKRGL